MLWAPWVLRASIFPQGRRFQFRGNSYVAILLTPSVRTHCSGMVRSQFVNVYERGKGKCDRRFWTFKISNLPVPLLLQSSFEWVSRVSRDKETCCYLSPKQPRIKAIAVGLRNLPWKSWILNPTERGKQYSQASRWMVFSQKRKGILCKGKEYLKMKKEKEKGKMRMMKTEAGQKKPERGCSWISEGLSSIYCIDTRSNASWTGTVSSPSNAHLWKGICAVITVTAKGKKPVNYSILHSKKKYTLLNI